MWDTIIEWLNSHHTAWTAGLIIFAMGVAMLVLFLIWISTERRLWRATRTETIIDHRHSTPNTVDFVITNPMNMKGYRGTFFDPYEFHLVYGKDDVEFKTEYIGRMGNNYKFRLLDLEPATAYTDVKIIMGSKSKMKQPVANVWTRDAKDRIISIKEATPIDKDIDQVLTKADNIVQRKVNEGYFRYALHYGNSKNRWIDVEKKLLKKTTKAKTTSTKSTTAKKVTTQKKTTTTKK